MKKLNNKINCKIITIAYSIFALIGILTCTICDIVINNELTWSILVNSSVTFGYLITVPLINNGKKGILISLIAITILMIPFLFILNSALNASNLFLTIGTSMYIVIIPYLWIIFLLFKKLKNRELLWASIAWFLLIILNLLINIILNKIINEPIIDIWDIVTFSILLIISISSFIFDLILKKKKDN